MTPTALFRRLVVASVALLPSVVFAHPGHDGGHDLTWDFSGGVAHVLGSPYHLLPLVAAAVVGVLFFRRASDERKSSAKRAKSRD